MCRTLGVSRQGFYDWESRPPSDHQVTDWLLAAEIEAIWECSAHTYGAPRVHAWLRRQGYRVSRKRVARIMREHGWVGVTGRRRPRTTIVDRNARAAEDLVARNFNPAAPDVTWAGDITYVPTGEGWLFLATVIDLFSRRVIGWGVADHLRTPLVAAALEMAAATRGGHVDGVVFHSDRGCQYTSGEYRQLCERLGVTQSMGATGICFDNSPAEAFFASLKRELVHRRRFATRAEARRDIIRWIEGWYNARRLHSSIAYMTPNEKEAAWHTDRLAA
jgi:transposase InsO family protein